LGASYTDPARPTVPPTETAPKWRPTGRSELARELAALPARRRRFVPDAFIVVLDAVVTACAAAVDDDDPRPLYERIPAAVEPVVEGFDWSQVEQQLATLGDKSPDELKAMLPDWLQRIDKPGFRAFARRLFGAAAYDRIERALKADAALFFVAARRALRFSLMYGAAIDECLRLLSAEQLSEIPGAGGLKNATVMEMLVQFDQVLERWAESGRDPSGGGPAPTGRADRTRECDGGTPRLPEAARVRRIPAVRGGAQRDDRPEASRRSARG
jgi:hypothetical protein